MGGIDGLGDRARFGGTTIVTGIYVMLGGMVLFASIVGILDPDRAAPPASRQKH